MVFFIYFQAISASDFIDEFIKKIPNYSMELLQCSLHEKVKTLNYHEKNKKASQKMLHLLNECLTYEIKYLESQIKNKYVFDQKAVKQAGLFLMVAAVCTYFTYYFHKKSSQADLAVQKNIKWSEYNRRSDFLCRNKIEYDSRVLLASVGTYCSYLVFFVYAFNAYALDPDRNNEFLLKYQQLLKLVKLIQETQA